MSYDEQVILFTFKLEDDWFETNCDVVVGL